MKRGPFVRRAPLRGGEESDGARDYAHGDVGRVRLGVMRR